MSASPHTGGYILVSYRQGLVLRIERAATQVAPPRLAGRTKLTAAALQELVSLACECAVIDHLV